MNIKEEPPETNSLHLVADTNLFFEFKKLNELPWAELNADPIVILISKPVLDEIDKHKNQNGRTRDRAIEIFKTLRSSLKTGGADIVIQEASPRVLLRHIGSVRPDEKLRDQIDFQKNDDRLVGILSTLIADKHMKTVELFTDDTGPVSTAQGLGLPFRFIEDDWRRPPQQTSEVKRIKALQKDLATYRSLEPNINIQHGETIKNGAVKIIKRVVKTLTSSELNTVIERLKLKHPLQEDFTPPPIKTIKNPLSGAKTECSYEAPNQEDIDQYREVAYPKWIEDCKATIRKLPDLLSSPEQKAFVRWSISNVGTRPARQVRIEFKAEGAIELVRAKKDDDEETSTGVTVPQSRLSLPKPPSIPAFKETQKEIAPPKSAASKGFDVAKLSNVGTSLKNLNTGSATLRAAQASLGGPLFVGSAFKDILDSPFQRALKDQQRFNGIINPPYFKGARALSGPTFEHVIPRIDHLALRPHKHDPEAFYFEEWEADMPVKIGCLTCDLWRHQRDVEKFEYEVVFFKDNDTKSAVLCTIHAENLTEPASSRIQVSKTIEEFSILDEALAMVDEV